MPMRLSLLLITGLLAACGTTRHCEGDFPYQRAQSLPPPAPVEGLSWPESPSAMKIPPPQATVVPYASPGQTDAKGKPQTQCLDVPPRMVSGTQPAKAPAPAKP